MTLKTARPHGETESNMTKKVAINQDVFLREACGNAARVWVLAGAKPTKQYTYVDNRWVEISIRFNGEEAPPRRREGEMTADEKQQRDDARGINFLRELDFLSPETDARQAATAKRLEDLGSDRSADA